MEGVLFVMTLVGFLADLAFLFCIFQGRHWA